MSLPRSTELENVLGQARDIARQVDQPLSTGHILLALFTVSNGAAIFLEDRNISLDELLGLIKEVPGEAPNALERVRRRAQRIANGAGSEELNSLHVLAALVRENESQGHELLARSSTDLSGVRATIMSYATGALPLPRRREQSNSSTDTSHDDGRGDRDSRSRTSLFEDSPSTNSEDAPSPISFHPSLGVDSKHSSDRETHRETHRETERESEQTTDSESDAVSESAPTSSPLRPDRSRARAHRRGTQVETLPPDSKSPPQSERAEADSPASDAPDAAEPREDGASAADDYTSSAREAAESLGKRLFDDSEGSADDESNADPAPIGSPPSEDDQSDDRTQNRRSDLESERGGEVSEEEPELELQEARSEGGEGLEEESDLAGGRVTTIPPTDSIRREQSESWKPELVEAYALDEEEYSHLCEFGRNLTREAALGGIDRVIGRDDEVTKLIDIVGKRRSNNPILVGEPGVGKTAIVEGLAREFVRMADDGNDRGERIIVELELGRLLSGTQLRGALSERLLGVKEEVERADGDVIVFLDEIHAWLDAGGNDGGDAAGELKTAMARGRFPCIGATTNGEFREFVEADPAFERRFDVVLVDEPDAETSREIAEGICPYYENHHAVHYTDEALDAAVRMSRRYIHDRRLPDKAIGVLDLAGSRAARVGDYEIGRRQIAEVVAEMAGLPVDRLTQNDRERFLSIEDHLHEEIVGQRHVIETVAEVLRRNYAGFRGQRPIGSLLFLGPTGVGKTETVKVLADFLFHDRDAVVQIDMSEYMKSHAVSRFVGAPPGYVGYDQGGQLTEAIRRRPYQIVLLDEIEKAHRDVLNVLLQLFEEGVLTDGKGGEVDFSNALIVMTSNLGATLFEEHRENESSSRIGFGSSTSSKPETGKRELTGEVLESARDYFSPELWNRIDEKLVFLPLSRGEIAEIARLQLAESAERIAEESGIALEFGDGVIDHLIENGGYEPELGARPMRQAIQRIVEGTVARAILRGQLERGDRAKVERADGEIVCSI